MENKPITVKAKGVSSKDSKFKTMTIKRRALNPHDVLIEIKYAGICHSDIHSARSEWKQEIYPLVPGHEIAGVVKAVGSNVKKFKVGDNAGVGCLVNSCRNCDFCKNGYEQQCKKNIGTYGNKDYYNNNEITYGGYSQAIVVDEDFVIKVPKNAPLEYVAPLLCAGITTYSPIMFSKVKRKQKVAVAGFGGLGVMAIKYAKKFGADVSVIARNKKKQKEADELGVKLYGSIKEVDEQFDLVISTIPTIYDPLEYVQILKIGGELALLGLPPTKDNWKLSPAGLIFNGHRKIYGSLIGGVKITQEMLNFSLKHKIYPEIEIISIEDIDEAYEKLTTGKAKFRYVIDMSTFK